MGDIGYYGILLAGFFSLYAGVASFWGGKLRSPELIASSRSAAYVVTVLTTIAVLALEYILLTDNFSFAGVATTSNRSLPFAYKGAALWGGQANSLLFWVWLLTIFSAVVHYQNREKNRPLMPFVTTVIMGTALFFYILLIFSDNPFWILSPTPPDGRGLNPLLQDPAMVIHPPMLYLGYIAWTIPFAFAIAALVTGRLGDEWIRTTRRWSLAAWCFLGVGNLLGAWWAYRELGWGGYWGWDPVENVSILPWITGTAFLHSVMLQEKKGMLKVWNLVLIMMTFTLSIFGTFIVRSGVISSVHAFAQSNLGFFFLVYLGVVIGVSLGLLFWRLDKLQSANTLDSFLSRESTFLVNNLILVGAAFSIWWGTVFPLISEAITGTRVTVGPPFFNRVNVPIGISLLLLLGVGPVIAWRKASAKHLKKHFMKPILIGFIAGMVLFALGVRHFYALLALSLGAFVLTTIVGEFYRGTRARQRTSEEGAAQALVNLTRKNKRRYGGYIVHLGIVAIFAGIAASSAFQVQKEVTLRPGEMASLGDYWLQYQDAGERSEARFQTVFTNVSLRRNGMEIEHMLPARRLYRNPETPTTEVAIRSTLKEDVYILLGSVNEDGSATFRFFLNPLVSWIWIGGLIFVLGTIIIVLPEPQRRRSPAPRVPEKVVR